MFMLCTWGTTRIIDSAQKIAHQKCHRNIHTSFLDMPKQKTHQFQLFLANFTCPARFHVVLDLRECRNLIIMHRAYLYRFIMKFSVAFLFRDLVEI